MTTNHSPFANFISNKNVEDSLKANYLHRPTQDAHHAVEARHNASTSVKIQSLLSTFNGHDIFVVDAIKYALKGAALGALYGVTAGMLVRNFSSLAVRKITQYQVENTFATVKLWKNAVLSSAFAGAGAGLGYYGFYECIWTRNSTWSKFNDMLTGYGIYGTALVSALVHPGLWWAGALGGVGFAYGRYFLSYGNHSFNRATPGFVIPVGNISEEEREKQRLKDIIHNLGQQPHIKYNALSEL